MTPRRIAKNGVRRGSKASCEKGFIVLCCLSKDELCKMMVTQVWGLLLRGQIEITSTSAVTPVKQHQTSRSARIVRTTYRNDRELRRSAEYAGEKARRATHATDLTQVTYNN